MKVMFAESHNLDRPDPVGSHHYIHLFQEAGHDCFWLGPAISPLHIFKPDQVNRYRFQLWRKGLQEREGIKWLLPLTLLFYYNRPLLRSLLVGRNQYRFCLPPVARQLGRYGWGEVDLLWCAGPVAYSLLDLVPHQMSCYRLADRLDQFSGIPANVGELQKALIKRVDFVLATSQALYEWAKAVRSEGVYYLPNGVSDQFSPAGGGAEGQRAGRDGLLRHEAEQEDAVNLESEPLADFPVDGRPVAVYVGTLDTRFDLKAVSRAVDQLKEVHFLLIGPVTDKDLESGLRTLDGADNFTRLGPKAYRVLPLYLRQSAVGLIPFKLNQLTAAVNPIKYYEYLACGLPVVAPPMRELVAMEGPLQLYGSPEDFAGAIEAALREGAAEREKRVAFAAEHTWRSRYKVIEQIIAELGSRRADR